MYVLNPWETQSHKIDADGLQIPEKEFPPINFNVYVSGTVSAVLLIVVGVPRPSIVETGG